ncbi:MAG: hypothetical protein ABFS34_14550 [Gemmatimonadota bacterium]
MVTISQLWLPIVLSAVAVFVASSVIHMALPWHAGDFDRLDSEDDVMSGLRGAGVTPGSYVIPHARSGAERKTDEFQHKLTIGPVGFLAVVPSGEQNMGKSLTQWFVFCLVVSVFAAYLASRAVSPGADYLAAFRFAGTAAFLCYAVALWQDSIFFARKWRASLTLTLDGLIYAGLTAGMFGWLWPV